MTEKSSHIPWPDWLKEVERMAKIHDPEGTIPAMIRRLGAFAGARVLDIGYGDRRSIRSYSADAEFVVGIDPAEDPIKGMDCDRPLKFVRGRAESLPFTGASFDRIVFSWSL